MSNRSQTINHDRTQARPGDRSVGDHPTTAAWGAGLAGRRFGIGHVILGRYRVTGELGQGGMGVVYRCFDEVAGIDVALKALPPEVAHNSGEMEEVRENFRLVSKLHHPNIANVNTLERNPVTGETYLVMECVKGLDLRQWARKRRGEGRPLTLDEVLIIARYIASALDYAHEQKIVHRDVKPGNVRVNFDGEIKVLDFGLAAQLHTSVSRASQARHGTSGTGPYMAPEQWQGRRQGAAADQYALGATIYELLCGAPPFENPDPAVLREAVLKEYPLPLLRVPPHVNAALLRALAKEPECRFASCGDFVKALAGTGVSSAGLPHGAEAQKRGAEGKSRTGDGEGHGRETSRLVLRWGIAAAAVALVCGGGYRLHRGRQASEQARWLAEQSSRLDASQREKISELKWAAERALAADDLETAGARIAELRQTGGAAIATELQKQYEPKAGERGTNRRYATASVAYDAAQKLDPGQGFEENLKDLKVEWLAAEAARQGKGWGQALIGYDVVLVKCKGLAERDAVRQDAKTQGKAAEQAKKEAEQAKSDEDAKDLYAEGTGAVSRAAERFEGGSFAEASELWRGAAETFASAQSLAHARQAYRKARDDFESAVVPNVSLFKQYGGPKWTDVDLLRDKGAQAANDPAKGRIAYTNALAGLPAALKEARLNELQLQLGSLLELARKARAESDWGDVILRASSAQAFVTEKSPSDFPPEIARLVQEAQKLKSEAEGKQETVLRIVARVGGREVGATIKTGADRYPSGKDIKLERDKEYNFDVSYSGDRLATGEERRYVPVHVRLTANWRGVRTEKVALEEQERPRQEAEWVSPLTGMVFVWVPSLKMWVGKYEVTNAEYQKMIPDHDSLEGINGDRQPVVQVNFDDAKAYAAWLTEREHTTGVLPKGFAYRLPCESEWMACARCGDGREFPWGSNWPPRTGQEGNYCGQETKTKYGGMIDGYDDGFVRSCDVELSRSNPWGLFGLGGNVWECCAKNQAPGGFGGWKGGSWRAADRVTLSCAYRSLDDPSDRCSWYGFRLVLSE